MRFSTTHVVTIVAAGVLSTNVVAAQTEWHASDSPLVARNETPLLAEPVAAAGGARASEPAVDPTVTRSTADLMRALDEQGAIIARLSKCVGEEWICRGSRCRGGLQLASARR